MRDSVLAKKTKWEKKHQKGFDSFNSLKWISAGTKNSALVLFG